MARTGFLISAAAAAVFAGAFLFIERGSPGMSFPVAFLVMQTALVLFAYTKSSAEGLSSDARMAGWLAVGLTVLTGAYLGAWFGPWFFAALGLLAVQVPMALGLLSSAKT